MTTVEWIDKAKQNQGALISLLRNYHPAMPGEKEEMRISAPAAEAACEVVRAEIREKGGNPIAQFEAALIAGDSATVGSLLDEAWFGVPESRSCWSIPGFREAVDLLDDPPEDEESNTSNDPKEWE